MIREGTVADAAAVARVHVESWQAIYRGHFPDDYLDSLSAERRAQQWTSSMSEGTFELAVYDTGDDDIAGFVCIGPSRDHDADPSVGEVAAIYLRPSYWRAGIGTQLIAWAQHASDRHGWSKLTLWVLDGNTSARAFYERVGWTPDGAAKSDSIGGRQITEIRYVWLRTPSEELKLRSSPTAGESPS
jgi:RimJ/RimL family protein N-acetyltransferase